jgi:hypothetical protein
MLSPGGGSVRRELLNLFKKRLSRKRRSPNTGTSTKTDNLLSMTKTERSRQRIISSLVFGGIAAILTARGQQVPSKADALDAVEERQVAAIENRVAKQLQQLQRQARSRIMGRLSASERNTRLVCTLAWTGTLKEREGTDAGVVSFITATPEKDPALQKLVTFPKWSQDGEYSWHHFDVAAWPMRDATHSGSYAVRIEMRQGLYWDWADSHITDDSLNNSWWRPLVAPQCKRGRP